MRKIDDGEKKRKRKKKITVEIVATNVVVTNVNGRLQRRPLVPKNIKLIGVHLLAIQVRAPADHPGARTC